MDRLNLAEHSPSLGNQPLQIAADARIWAWEQALHIYGRNFDIDGHKDTVEKTARRLADFVQTGTFAAL